MEIGSIVECVNDNWDYHASKMKMPIKGNLYTVVGFCVYPKGVGIYIEEVANKVHITRKGVQWKIDRAAFLKTRFKEVLPPMEISIEEYISETA